MTETPSNLKTSLISRGWVHLVAQSASAEFVLEEIRRIGDLIGIRTPGRAGALEEVLQPMTQNDAHPQSLSAQYGLGSLPFHAEQSHRLRPCRYLLLGCIDPGVPSVLTWMLDWRKLDFSLEELEILESAPLLVRSGRRSFYSTILPSDRAFFRYDPCCLQAVEERGRSALRLVEQRLAMGSPESHQWSRGDILIIDNWRLLHGRGPTALDSGRRLARILIDA